MRSSTSSNKAQKEKDQIQKQFQGITGATSADASRLLKKSSYSIERACELFFTDAIAQKNAAGAADGEGSTGSGGAGEAAKKVGEIWERYKDPSNPLLITIEGTMKLCEDLDIDPENDPVLFCLAADLGSKTVGEWPKDSWVKGWNAISPRVDSLSSMKDQLPRLRKKMNSDPEYFKKVYQHVFSLSLAPGSRTLPLDSALSFWQVLIPPALASSPSALSHLDPESGMTSPPEFTPQHLEMWIEFQKEKGKAVSKDTWTLFLDFVRQIDGEFKVHDETAAWPSTIDDFVEYVRARQT